MDGPSYVEAAIAWGRACLERLASGAEAMASPPPSEGQIQLLVKRFALSGDERRVIDLALAVESSLVVARLARSLSGGRGLSVEIVREALAIDAEKLLHADSPLRAHGLITVDALPGGPASAQAELRLGLGLGRRLSGRPLTPDELGVGIEWVSPSVEKPWLAKELEQLVRDELVDVTARWVAIGGSHPSDAQALAGAVSKRLKRSIILLDGPAVGSLDLAARFTLLAALRREADLRDAPIIVDGGAGLGAGWRALGVRPAPDRSLPAPIVILDLGRPLQGRPHPGFSIREVTFAPPAEAAAAAAAATTTPTETGKPPEDDGFDSIRRQAAFDAARAMGKPIEVPRATLPAKAVVPRALADKLARDGEVVARGDGQAAVESASSTPAAVEPVAIVAPPPEPKPVPVEPKPAEARPPLPVAAAPAVVEARPASAEAPSVAPVVTPAPPAPSEATVMPLVAAAADASATPAPPAAAEPDPSEKLPFVPLPTDGAIKDVLAILPTVGNPLQRAEILRELAKVKGHPQIAALMRAHATSTHPAVRAAAEEGMANFFGPNWNRTKAIPKPVQPPRSDDGGRGPGGAF